MKAFLFNVLPVALLTACAAVPSTVVPTAHAPFALPPLSQQIAIREGWLAKHHALILDMMRRHDIDMWLVVNEEFHDDPLTQYVAPPRPYTGNRDVFVFIDTGSTLRKVAVTGYAEEALKRFFETQDDPEPVDKRLKALYEQYHPQHIGLAMDGKRGAERGLTYASYRFLAEAMGAEAEKHFVSAAGLIDDYLQARIPDELETYRLLVRITDEITRGGLSAAVITPGRTTVGEVRRWFYDQIGARGLTTWFQPDLRVQRRGDTGARSRGFLAVADEALVLMPGDVVHVDFGITAMGFSTDWQKHAYLLRPGESDAPDGLKNAMANTNALQDALMTTARPGLDAGAVYRDVMKEMDRRGIRAQIYSHAIGTQGHGLGPGFDYRSAQQQQSADRVLQDGTYLSIELNTTTAVPEWDGQDVQIMLEDDAYLTPQGYRLFVPRQTAFYLIPAGPAR